MWVFQINFSSIVSPSYIGTLVLLSIQLSAASKHHLSVICSTVRSLSEKVKFVRKKISKELQLHFCSNSCSAIHVQYLLVWAIYSQKWIQIYITSMYRNSVVSLICFVLPMNMKSCTSSNKYYLNKWAIFLPSIIVTKFFVRGIAQGKYTSFSVLFSKRKI